MNRDPPDELDRRIRDLEAERMRPVPPTPVMVKKPQNAAEWTAARRLAATLAELLDADDEGPEVHRSSPPCAQRIVATETQPDEPIIDVPDEASAPKRRKRKKPPEEADDGP